MRAFSEAALLRIWEQALVQKPAEWALTVLAAADPETTPETLATLDIGQRDARLLELRERIFGPQVVGVTLCPGCRKRLEVTFKGADIPATVAPETVDPLLLSAGEFEVRFRLPDSRDLMAIAEERDLYSARHQLLERCVLAVDRRGEERSADELPANIVTEISEQMSRANPLGDVQLALSCPECGAQWQETFDIVRFLRDEINAWAHRVLYEVNALAVAYGWRESDILALSPQRRQVYLEMVGQ